MRVEAGDGAFFWDEELSQPLLAQLTDQSLADTLAAWQQLKAARGDGLPSRKLFFPESVPSARGRLTLWIVRDGGADFEMIVQSSRTMMLYHLLPGKITVGGLSNAGYEALIMAHYTYALNHRMPFATRIYLERTGQPTVYYDRLVLPFAEDGVHTDYLLTCADFTLEAAQAIRDTIPDFNQQSPGWSLRGS
jgi:hypothetical protein